MRKFFSKPAKFSDIIFIICLLFFSCDSGGGGTIIGNPDSKQRVMFQTDIVKKQNKNSESRKYNLHRDLADQEDNAISGYFLRWNHSTARKEVCSINTDSGGLRVEGYIENLHSVLNLQEFIYEDTLYTLGYDFSGNKKIFMYNFESNSTRSIAVEKADFLAGAKGGKIFSLKGIGSATGVYEIDQETGEATFRGTIAGLWGVINFSLLLSENFIYVLGGGDDSFQKNIYIYDLESGVTNSVKVEMVDFLAGIRNEKMITICSGDAYEVDLDDGHEAWLGTIDDLEYITNAAVVMHGNYIYLLGGKTENDTTIDKLYIYDVDRNMVSYRVIDLNF